MSRLSQEQKTKLNNFLRSLNQRITNFVEEMIIEATTASGQTPVKDVNSTAQFDQLLADLEKEVVAPPPAPNPEAPRPTKKTGHPPAQPSQPKMRQENLDSLPAQPKDQPATAKPAPSPVPPAPSALQPEPALSPQSAPAQPPTVAEVVAPPSPSPAPVPPISSPAPVIETPPQAMSASVVDSSIAEYSPPAPQPAMSSPAPQSSAISTANSLLDRLAG